MIYTLSQRILPTFYKEYGPNPPYLIHKTYSGLSSAPITALHYHHCMELGICVRGQGITYVDQRQYRYCQGDLQVIPEGMAHLSMSDPNVETEWIWITLRPLDILDSVLKDSEPLKEKGKSLYSGVFHPWEYPRLAQLIHCFRELEEGEDGFALQCAFLCGQLVLECFAIGEVDRVKGIVSAAAQKVMPAVHYIRLHYGDQEAMREEKIAATCQMSCSHFRALFKSETGLTVREFILRTRLVNAAHLLENTNESVLNVAMESGFGQISCFNRAFLKYFGKTPTAFRKYRENGSLLSGEFEGLEQSFSKN